MGPRWWGAVRLAGGAVILGVLLWRVGTGPFLTGLRTVNGWSLLAATGITVVTTVCAAWRWSLVARGLGVGLPVRSAVAAYYRSQFLNTTLPGGVLGDLHRGVRHGRDAGDVGRGLRAVAWERGVGQFVQVVLTLLVLCLLPSPARLAAPVIAGAVLLVGLAMLLLTRAPGPVGESRPARAWRAARADLRAGVLARNAYPRIVLASVLVVAGHAATFLVAARAVGVAAPPARLLPLALLVLVAMAVPANIGGWGPREGVAAWAFGAAGLGAGAGVAVAVAYGVLVFIASLPGAVILVATAANRRVPTPTDPIPADLNSAGPIPAGLNSAGLNSAGLNSAGPVSAGAVPASPTQVGPVAVGAIAGPVAEPVAAGTGRGTGWRARAEGAAGA